MTNTRTVSPSSTAPPSWRAQSEQHFALRKQVIARLQRLHPLLATDAAMRHGGGLTRIPELVQRLELMLYRAAHSLHEYTNPCTLERRVHALVTMLGPQTAYTQPQIQIQTQTHKTTPPASRKRAHDALPSPTPTSKRVRRSTATYARTTSLASRAVPHASCLADAQITEREAHDAQEGAALFARSPSSSSLLLLDGNQDLLRHVFAFVDGSTTLQCRAVNRYFARVAPTYVRSLTLDVADPRLASLCGRVGVLLQQCHHLHHLEIRNHRASSRKQGFTRAFPASASSTVTFTATATATVSATTSATTKATAKPIIPHGTSQPERTQLTGEAFLLELRDAFQSSTRALCPALQSLTLRAPFDCASESESTIALLQAFATHRQQYATAVPRLQRLVLDTTVLGDRRLQRLCDLLARAPAGFASLRHLELRNNFIGAAGVDALCGTVMAGAQPRLAHLETLSLRRNILTDRDALLLATHVVGRHRALTHVDLADNYIGRLGFAALARAQPLVAIDDAGNCMNKDAVRTAPS